MVEKMSAHTSEINNLKNKRMILILCLWRDGAIGASKKYTKIPLDCVHACKHNTHHIYRIYARAHIYNILNRNGLAAAVAAPLTFVQNVKEIYSTGAIKYV